MLFHPWCFDIFCPKFTWDDFYSFPRSGEVSSAQEQFWCHNPGSEYLAANPLYVPGLLSLLARVGEHNIDKVPEIIRPTALEDSHTGLASLPLDIRLLIVGFLESGDITNLRITSRAFAQSPNSV